MIDSSTSRPSITFIVPVFNAEESVLETLNSIAGQQTLCVRKIVIVDDGSSDSSVPLIQQWIREQNAAPRSLDVLLIQIKHRGEAGAVNKGLTQVTTDFVAWVESDVRLHPDWLETLLAEFGNSDIAGAGGLLLPAEDDGAVAKVFGYEIAYKIRFNRGDARHITSANALYRASIFAQLGSCRDELGESSFDSEFNHRIRQAGFRLRCNPQALAWHHFKSHLSDCLKRSWWYGYRRPFVRTQVLYPFDRAIGLFVLSSLLLPLGLVLFGFYPGMALLAFGFFLLIPCGYSVFLYCHFRDSVLLYSPLLFLLRNGIFLFAYFCGWFDKWLRGSSKTNQ